MNAKVKKMKVQEKEAKYQARLSYLVATPRVITYSVFKQDTCELVAKGVTLEAAAGFGRGYLIKQEV